MRPRTLEDIVGQDHIIGPGKLLRRAIEADRLSSIILFGPPGCGKTSLAEVIARVTRRAFDRSSGVLSNVAGLRKSLQAARYRRDALHQQTILFIDEIHRFNKAQQDVLLPYVEEGAVTLIGATTHNPFFFINNPLISRSQVFQLEPVGPDAILVLLRRALSSPQGLAHLPIRADDDALRHLAEVCDGDARRAARRKLDGQGNDLARFGGLGRDQDDGIDGRRDHAAIDLLRKPPDLGFERKFRARDRVRRDANFSALDRSVFRSLNDGQNEIFFGINFDFALRARKYQ
ncbi:MAG: AAA family ATPase, partial [Kiritimatiellae bacterium]|nr:AAA family ATPase [Kiritimatiellia bacterium]